MHEIIRTASSLPSRNERLLFLRKFFRHGTQIASFAPSSAVMAAAMCKHVDATRPQTILELGAGTGAVTEVVYRKMHPLSRLVAVEVDEQFAAILKRRCPMATVLHADVQAIDAELATLEIDRCDLILSGLPVPSLSHKINASVFACHARFGPAAYFSQLTLIPWVYRGLYRRLYEQVEFQLVRRNLPPGGVYHCRSLKPDFADQLPGK